jgi:hypothetical protein
MFELTYLVAGGKSQTIVVALRFVSPSQMVFEYDFAW